MITIEVKADQALATMAAQAKQLPFAAMVALDNTPKDVRDAQRAGMRQRFTIRKPTLLANAIQVIRRPTKEDLVAEVGTTAGFGFFADFEAGGFRTAFDRAKPLAIPSSNIRPTKPAIVPLELYPSALRLVSRRGVTGTLARKAKRTARGVLQVQGKRRTFILDPTEHLGVKTWGVYQRTGPGKHDIRLLWTLRQKVPIPASLQLVAGAAETLAKRWAVNFRDAFEKAMKTAR
jgi:hypothetical protein